MPENLACVFHHNFYPKPKVDLEVADIIPEIKRNEQTYSKDMILLVSMVALKDLQIWKR